MKKRILYIEVLRIVACLAVIYNHLPRSGFFQFMVREPGSALYFFDMALSVSCKFAVPAFFAVSGAMMLGKEISLKKLWSQRIPRIALILVVFSVLMQLIDVAAGVPFEGVKAFIFRGYESYQDRAYWYLYAYLAFLIASPMLSAMLRNMRTADIAYMLGVTLFFRSILPAAEQLYWKGLHHLNSDLSELWLISDIVYYPVLGYFLHHRLNRAACRKLALPLWIGAAAGVAITCCLAWQEYLRIWSPDVGAYHDLFGGIYCAAVFATVRLLCEHMPHEGVPAKVIAGLSGNTLGVYLLHGACLNRLPFFKETIWIPMDALGLPHVFCGWICIAAVFLFCAAVTALLKKLPGFRWMLS